MKTYLLVLTLLLSSVTGLSAQTLTNPSTVQFTASADQNAVVNTVAVLTSYEIRLYDSAGATLKSTLNIGKPTPDATNTISNSQLATVYATVPAGTYTVKVAAVGPGGANETPASAPFTVAVPKPAAPTAAPIIK